MSSNPLLPKPKAVKLAIQLLWASFALGVVNTAINWTDTISQMTQPLPIDKGLFALIIASFTFCVLFWLFYKISTGRNWARITFLCFFLIGLPFSVPQLLAMIEQAPLKVSIALLLTLLQLIALIALFSNTGNASYRLQKESRSQSKI